VAANNSEVEHAGISPLRGRHLHHMLHLLSAFCALFYAGKPLEEVKQFKQAHEAD
jgi:hypothetical protein